MDLNDLMEIKQKEIDGRKKFVLRCCTAAGCVSSNSQGVKEELTKAVKAAGLEEQVEVRGVGCLKLCCQGPLISLLRAGENGHGQEPMAMAKGEHPFPTQASAAVGRLPDHSHPGNPRNSDFAFKHYLDQCRGRCGEQQIETTNGGR